MTESFSAGLMLLLWSVVLGAIICVLYDFFRLQRRHSQSRVFLFFTDFIFCIIAAAMFAVMFFNLTFGRVRAYSFVCAAAGFALWRFTFGRLLYKSACRLLDAINVIIKKTFLRIKNAAKYLHGEYSTRRYCRKIKREVAKGPPLIKSKGKGTENEHEACKAQ